MKPYEYYNKNFIFISDGTWYKKNSVVKVDDNDSIWYTGNKFPRDKDVYTLEEITSDSEHFHGGFRGTRVCEFNSEGGRSIGQEYEDGEVCCLDEFTILSSDLTNEEKGAIMSLVDGTAEYII